jgi:hypothetical protein
MPTIAGCDRLSELVSKFEMAVMISAEKTASSLDEASVPASQKKDLAPPNNDNATGTDSKNETEGQGSKMNVTDRSTPEQAQGDNMKMDSLKKEKVGPMEIDKQETSKAKEEDPKRVLAVSQEQVNTYSLAAHRLSPANSGVYDELLAFIKLGVLHASTDGIPYLAPEWASNVDVIVLDDMDAAWGTDADPDGRHCMHFELRDALEDQWIKSEFGWALVEDPDDIIFDLEVLQEWRQAFEGKVEEKANLLIGIGRFGL